MENLSLGQKIKSARLDKNLTQQEVTEDFITRNMLSKLENDLAKPSIKTIEYLAKRLDKPISYFLESMVEGISFYSDNDKINSLELTFEYSCLLIKSKEYEKCINYTNDVIKEYNVTKESIYYGRLLYNIGLCYVNLEVFNNAKDLFEHSITYLKPLKDFYYLSNCYMNLNLIYFTDKDYYQAEESIKKALNYFRQSHINDPFTEIILYYRLGFNYYKQQKYNYAIDKLLYALELSKQYSCYYKSGEIHMLLGIIYSYLKKYEDSIIHSNTAIKFFDFSESYLLKASSQQNQGITYIALHKYDEAYNYLMEALKYYEQVNNLSYANSAKCLIVECFAKKHNFIEVISYSEEINLEVIAPSDKGNLFKHIGLAYLNLNEMKKAIEYLYKAEEILLTTNKYNYLSDTYNILAEFYSKNESYKDAYTYSCKAKEFLKLYTYDNILHDK